jgi:hypothetical protein
MGAARRRNGREEERVEVIFEKSKKTVTKTRT